MSEILEREKCIHYKVCMYNYNGVRPCYCAHYEDTSIEADRDRWKARCEAAIDVLQSTKAELCLRCIDIITCAWGEKGCGPKRIITKCIEDMEAGDEG